MHCNSIHVISLIQCFLFLNNKNVYIFFRRLCCFSFNEFMIMYNHYWICSRLALIYIFDSKRKCISISADLLLSKLAKIKYCRLVELIAGGCQYSSQTPHQLDYYFDWLGLVLLSGWCNALDESRYWEFKQTPNKQSKENVYQVDIGRCRTTINSFNSS